MDGNPKQQVAEKLRNGNSVLVTVSNDPSVDQLASAIGLALMLTKLGKHTTAVFSGKMPNVLQFLNPEKTIDTTVDGLRDFIISLDKAKADKLRYKVEDDVVKIFITPYKTKITSDDLNYTQGDFNVDLVVALGVHKRTELDSAITAHGRILHDATIITINNKSSKDGNLGAVDWTDENASCLAEMLVSISEALEGGILDEQMSTAFLTGIVAATERFKNDQTTPKVMTMAAQLMAAGANQQLIATNLQMSEKKPPEQKADFDSEQVDKSDGKFDEQAKDVSVDLSKDKPSAHPTAKPKPAPKQEKKSEEGKNKDDSGQGLHPSDDPHVSRDLHVNEDGLLSEIEDSVHAKHLTLNDEGRTNRVSNEDPAIKKLEDELSHDSTTNLLDLEDRMKSFDPSSQPAQQPAQEANNGPIGKVKSMATSGEDFQDKPTMGGTFNATADEAHDRRQQDMLSSVNKEVLSHKTIQPPQPNLEQPNGNLNRNSTPDSKTMMQDLEAARRAVEDAMNENQFAGGVQPTQALNAAPLPMDGGNMNDFDLSHAPKTSQMPQQNQQPQMNQMPQQQMNGGGMQPQNQQMQMPQQQMPQQNQQPQMNQLPQPQMQNPLFNMQNQQPQMNQMPQQQMNGGGMQPQNQQMQMPPQQAPPMPPQQAPPMPPFH